MHDGGDCGWGEHGRIGDGDGEGVSGYVIVIVIVRRGGEGLRRGVRGVIKPRGEAASGGAGAAETVW